MKVHPRRWLLRGAAAILCVLWLLSASSKVADPLQAYETMVLVTGPGLHTKLALAGIVAGEAALGALILFRVVQGVLPSVFALGFLTAGLMWVDSTGASDVPCGCLPSFIDRTVQEEIVVNLCVAGVLAALVVWDLIARRGRDAAVAAGPERS